MENVLLVFGGESYEHDISVVTASQIYNKTKLNDIKIVPLYISRDNKFYVYNSQNFEIKDFSVKNFDSKNKRFKEVVFVYGENCCLFQKTRFGLKEYIKTEKAIFACHGGSGENGKLVSFLNNFKIGTSSGSVEALGICMNKYLFKQVMKGLKIPVVSGFKINKKEYESNPENYALRFRFLKFPVILKANNGGSSIGLFVVENKAELDKKIKQAFEYDDEVLLEKYCKNAREFNIAVLGDSDNFEVSKIDEPIKKKEILDFTDKYLSGQKGKIGKCCNKNSMANQKRNFPAEISLCLSKRITDIAIKIFKNLNLSGVVRIDFLYQEETDKLYVCEVNSVPGSLAYYFFENNKITTNFLVEKLLNVCKSNKNNICSGLNKEFYTNILD